MVDVLDIYGDRASETATYFEFIWNDIPFDPSILVRVRYKSAKNWIKFSRLKLYFNEKISGYAPVITVYTIPTCQLEPTIEFELAYCIWLKFLKTKIREFKNFIDVFSIHFYWLKNISGSKYAK